MTCTDDHDARPIEFIGSSEKDLNSFPPAVQDQIRRELRRLQRRMRPNSGKTLKGYNGDVTEIIARSRDGTYRAVVLTKVKDVLCVLHCYKKRATSGIGTPKNDIDMINSRMKQALRGRTK